MFANEASLPKYATSHDRSTLSASTAQLIFTDFAQTTVIYATCVVRLALLFAYSCMTREGASTRGEIYGNKDQTKMGSIG